VTDSLYSPRRRTALVLSGTGTAGAYHAGVLCALHEAGVKIDLVAGRGMGAVGALFDAVDGGSRLWGADGPWRGPDARRLYRFRAPIRVAGWALAAGLVALVSPFILLAGAVAVYLAGLVATLVGLGGAGAAMTAWFDAVLARLFEPWAVPTIMPRAVAFALVVALAALAAGAAAARWRRGVARRTRGLAWWRLVGAPLSAAGAIRRFRGGLWHLIRGAAVLAEPPAPEVGRRYAELLVENLKQPGFKEVLVAAHDLDVRQDVVFAALAEPYRRAFFAGARRVASETRAAEAFDLAGTGRDHVVDALSGALSLPVVTEAHLAAFEPESYWRGEAHRLCDRPDLLARLLEETAAAGAEQVVVVTDAPAPGGPHALASRRGELKGRAGEYVRATETAALDDALRLAGGRFQGVFVVRPGHNPVGPYDFGGAYDERSDRWQSLEELVNRGYEDAYRQFIEPVVGASGDGLAFEAAPPDAPSGAPDRMR
jgi:hypothetical protein